MKREEPWKIEPDFKKWIDRDTGLRCCIVRHPEMGHLCGYVRLPAGPLRARLKAYRKLPGFTFGGKLRRRYATNHSSILGVHAHGGITWAGGLPTRRPLRGFWIGFDCAHCNDLAPKMKDLGMFMSGAVYRDFAYVERECADLAKQLKELL